MKKVKVGLRLVDKLTQLKQSQENFEYNLLDISHQDFNDVEKKCVPI